MKWNTEVDEKRYFVWCVTREMGLGGKFTPCVVLLSVMGSKCISPRGGTVLNCSTRWSFMTPSDLITASLAKIGCMFLVCVVYQLKNYEYIC